jgi:hypothetical protein
MEMITGKATPELVQDFDGRILAGKKYELTPVDGGYTFIDEAGKEQFVKEWK